MVSRKSKVCLNKCVDNHRLVFSQTAFLDRVAFETLPIPADGNDVFELDSDTGSSAVSVVVAIRGSSPLALATGLGWYLRHYCNSYPASWDNRRVNGEATGRQLETVDPAGLPRVSPKLRRHSAVRWRYCEYEVRWTGDGFIRHMLTC